MTEGEKKRLASNIVSVGRERWAFRMARRRGYTNNSKNDKT